MNLNFAEPKPNEESPHYQWAYSLAHRLAARGYFLTILDTMKAWELYSESLAAGWINSSDSER